ncbi:hypothetical protein ACJ72_01567 [Emergomyces africanus]|uniref:Uncharacterized protein n=1 Tax=Emergomyces africanus TaxID=1955775 RepID=A0A1B7P4Y3_9EURO|nr:hypothetical protein ACJ72_01567 [Emergomyces africanus]
MTVLVKALYEVKLILPAVSSRDKHIKNACQVNSRDETATGNDPNAKPTPRAITERLVRIKYLIRNGNRTTPTSTPKNLDPPAPGKPIFGKRKHRDSSSGKQNIKTETFIDRTSDIQTIKHEYAIFSGSSIDGMVISMSMSTPFNRARDAPSPPAGRITHNEDTDDGAQYRSRASEFIPVAKAGVKNKHNNFYVSKVVNTAEYA